MIDYPARDMTITVEAGIRMAALAETLTRERQRLPIDVPQADRATLGGVIAANWSGPLRYGQRHDSRLCDRHLGRRWHAAWNSKGAGVL